MHKKSQKHKQCPVLREMEKSTNSIWRRMGEGVKRTGKAGEQEGCDDRGNRLALNAAAFCLERCLSTETWQLCERQTGIW